MSRLEELIAELCLDGVEYLPLGEIATEMYRGSGIKRDQITETGTQCVRYGEIYTTYNIWFDSCVSHTDAEDIPSKKYFEHGDILFAITGESVDEIAKSCVYVGHDKCLAGGDIVVMKHNENPKYLAYALSTTDAQMQKSKGKVKSKVVHSSVPALKAIRVPLPSLPVQQEIVRILDKFTALEAKLETELEAELGARKKQYEYYRDKLFTFSHDVEWKTLGGSNGIADIGTGSRNTIDATEDGQYPFYVRSADILKINTYEYDEEAIITSGDGVGVGKILHYVNGKFGLHQRAYRIRIINNEIMTKYVYYHMKSNFERYILGNAVNSSVTSIRKPMLEKYPIPIPPLAEQERIVAILDRFDALINDITQGLPAEIAARRKQYEYYRDKLLTFKEAVL